jgi:DNA-binding CsgD family transcriptional regulator
MPLQYEHDERGLWPALQDQSVPNAIRAPEPARLTGFVTTFAEAMVDARRGSTTIRGQCRITPASGGTIIVEVSGSVDWATGTIQLAGTTPYAVDVRGADSADRDRPAPSAPPALTQREIEVACLLARGDSNARVAEVLRISPHTARRHTESVMLKLGASSRAQVGAILHGRRDKAIGA